MKANIIVQEDDTTGLTVISTDAIGEANTDVRVAVWQALANDAFARGESIEAVEDMLTTAIGSRVCTIGHTEDNRGNFTEVVFHVTLPRKG